MQFNLIDLKNTDYVIEQTPFAKGSFSTVHYAYERSLLKCQNANKKWACKKIDCKYSKQVESAKLAIAKLQPHPNIVTYKQFVMQSQHNCYLFMEYCNKGNLQSLIINYYQIQKKPIPDEVILDFLFQFCEGYKILIQNQIVHLDLKPENILLHSEEQKIYYKITDFDLIRNGEREPGTYDALYGNTFFAAPISDFEQQVLEIDNLFSLGVILYYMMYNQNHPYFEDNNEINQIDNKSCFIKQMISNAQKYGKPINRENQIARNKELVELVNRMLALDQSQRIAWDELFQHHLVVEQFAKNSYIKRYNDNLAISSNTTINSIEQLQSKKVSQLHSQKPPQYIYATARNENMNQVELKYNEKEQTKYISNYKTNILIENAIHSIYRRFELIYSSVTLLIQIYKEFLQAISKHNPTFDKQILTIIQDLAQYAQLFSNKFDQSILQLIKNGNLDQINQFDENILNELEKNAKRRQKELKLIADHKILDTRCNNQQIFTNQQIEFASEQQIPTKIKNFLEKNYNCLLDTSDDLQSKDILKVILVLIDIYDIAQENIYNQLFSSTAVFISDGLEGQNLNELKDKIIEKIGKIITNFIIQVD